MSDSHQPSPTAAPSSAPLSGLSGCPPRPRAWLLPERGGSLERWLMYLALVVVVVVVAILPGQLLSPSRLGGTRVGHLMTGVLLVLYLAGALGTAVPRRRSDLRALPAATPSLRTASTRRPAVTTPTRRRPHP